MDLFHVQRFYGEEEEDDGKDKAELEKERLKELKAKIKRKRKELEGEVPQKKKFAKLEHEIGEFERGTNRDLGDKENDDRKSRNEKLGGKVKNKKKRKDSKLKDLISPEGPENQLVSGGAKDVEIKYEKEGKEKMAKKKKKKEEKEKARIDKSIDLNVSKKKRKEDQNNKNGTDVETADISKHETKQIGKDIEKSTHEKKTKKRKKRVDGDDKMEHLEQGNNSDVNTENVIHERNKRDDTDGDVVQQSETSSKLNETESNENEARQSSELENKEEKKSDDYFKVLGSFGRKKEKTVVHRMLPKWIAEAHHITSDIEKAKMPIQDASFIEAFSKKNLKEQNIEFLFPVQSKIIPFILSQNSRRGVYQKVGLLPKDVCVSAPTGSGKTLAYTLPIIQILSKCEWRRLQALVILPSKDLALQVKNVMGTYAKGTHLKVGLASGVKSFNDEKKQLISKGHSGFISNIDILVCTPGRLVDHIDSTDGFSLEYLRFLVIDEADRLLGQSYHNWLEKIFDAVYKPEAKSSTINRMAAFCSGTSHTTASLVHQIQLPLQKLLFSATMTHNPEKLAPLKLYNPILFTAVGQSRIDGQEEETVKANIERYMLPESLEQKMTICEKSEKPLIVIYLIKVLQYSRVLCFTGSIESTHRLSLLVGECGIRTSEFSSTLNQTQRKGILRDFKNGKIDLLICSDSMSRGMDIENVDFVVSYDPPVNMKTYVHRVGRTARAGNRGTALTILASKEVYHFKKMLGEHGNAKKIQKIKISTKELEPLVDEYENALSSLKNSIKNENNQLHR